MIGSFIDCICGFISLSTQAVRVTRSHVRGEGTSLPSEQDQCHADSRKTLLKNLEMQHLSNKAMTRRMVRESPCGVVAHWLLSPIVPRFGRIFDGTALL